MKIGATYQKIELSYESFSAQCGISPEQARNFSVEAHVNFVNNQLSYQLQGYLLGKKHVTGYPLYVEAPDTWWQHFKLSWPAWMQRRWPCRMKKIEAGFETTEVRICPHLDICHGPETRGIHIAWMHQPLHREHQGEASVDAQRP